MVNKTTTINDLKALISIEDNIDFIPIGDNVLVKTEVKIKTVKSRIILPDAVIEKQDPNLPEGFISLTRTIKSIGENVNNIPVGVKVEINSKQEAIVGIRLDLSAHTVAAYKHIIDNMVRGLDKILEVDYPTHTIIFYDSIPSHLIVGYYENSKTT